MAVITEVSSDEEDELPPLIGSSGRPPATLNSTTKAPQTPVTRDDEPSDDDELPPLVADARSSNKNAITASPNRNNRGFAKARFADKDLVDNSDDELPPLHGDSSIGKAVPRATVAPSTSSQREPFPSERTRIISPTNSQRAGLGFGGTVSKGPSQNGPSTNGHSGKEPDAKAASPVFSVPPAKPSKASTAFERFVTEDIDDAIMLLEDGYYEEAETLADEVRRHAVSECDSLKEAVALRISTKARVAALRGRSGQAYDSALRAANTAAMSFAKRGDCVAEGLLLVAVAEAELSQDFRQDALISASKALSLFREVGDSRREILAERVLADVYLAMGRMLKALQATKAVSELFAAAERPRKSSEAREAAAAKMIEAKVHFSPPQPEVLASIKAAEQALALSERLGDPRGAAVACCQISTAQLQKTGNAEAAKRTALRAVSFAQESGNKVCEAAALHAAGSAYVALSNTEEAFKAEKRALSLAREMKEFEQISSCIDVIMSIHAADELPERAVSAAEEELLLAKKSNDLRREAYAQQKMATAMLMQDRPREAVRRAQEAAEKMRQAGDRRGEAKAMQLVVELQVTSKRHIEALRAAREVQKLLKDLGDVKGQVHILQMLTSLHMEVGDNEDALEAAYAQRSAYREAGYREEEAMAVIGVAEMLNNLRGPHEALKAAQEAVGLYQDIKDRGGEITALVQVAQLHLASQSPGQALQVAKSAQALAKEGTVIKDSPKSALAAAQAVSEALLALGRQDEAVSNITQTCNAIPEADEAAKAKALQGVAQVHLQVAGASQQSGRPPKPSTLRDALKASETALKTFRSLGDKQGEAGVLQQLFNVHLLSHDGPSAVRYARESLEISTAIGDEQAAASAMLALSQANLLARNFEEAMQACQESMNIWQKLGSKQNVGICEQVRNEIQNEKERNRRPHQPMGAAQSVRESAPSILPEKTPRKPGLGVGGFGASGLLSSGGKGSGTSTRSPQGVPAGGFRGSTSSLGGTTGKSGGFSSRTPESKSPAGGYAALAQGFTTAGFFSKPDKEPDRNANSRPSTQASSTTSSSAGQGMSTSRSSGGSSGSYGGGYSAGSTPGYNGGYSAGSSGGSAAARTFSPGSRQAVPVTGFGLNRSSGVPAGGFGGGGGVPSGGFGGKGNSQPASSTVADDARSTPAPAPTRRATRSAFAAFEAQRL